MVTYNIERARPSCLRSKQSHLARSLQLSPRSTTLNGCVSEACIDYVVAPMTSFVITIHSPAHQIGCRFLCQRLQRRRECTPWWINCRKWVPLTYSSSTLHQPGWETKRMVHLLMSCLQSTRVNKTNRYKECVPPADPQVCPVKFEFFEFAKSWQMLNSNNCK